MAASKRRFADDGRQTLVKLRKSISKGETNKLFESEAFVFELIDALHEESIDTAVKTEFLAALEQYGSDQSDAKCLDQISQRLLDIVLSWGGTTDNQRFLIQLMLTLTTLLVQNDLLVSETCGSLVTQLCEIIWRVNDVGSRPLRGCACQCLMQLETWSPGLLTCYKDRLVQALREERTHIFQDYAMLLSTVLSSQCQSVIKVDSSPADSQISAEDLVPPLSYLMENAFLFTPNGLWLIIQSVMKLVKSTVHVAPSIFKPLMLQNMASLDPCMLHIVLYIQKECQGEILTLAEEWHLLYRLTSQMNLLTFHPAFRLLILQWLKVFLQERGRELMDQQSSQKLQRMLRPTVFDSLDIHVDKLCVLISNYSVDQDQNMLKDVHYLKRLALTTGNEQATVGLYRVLFTAYSHLQTPLISDSVIKITQDLIVDYPHLIPLILDFLLAVKEKLNDSHVYLDTLLSLHNQVLNARYSEVLTYYHFFLQVLGASAKQPDMYQHKTLRFLLELVRYALNTGAAHWELGCAVLSVCKTVLLHHLTDNIYYELGELLFEMQSCFSDTDIQNRARLLYALLASACDEKIRKVLGTKLQGGQMLTQNITNVISGSLQVDVKKAEIVQMENSGLKWQRLSWAPVFAKSESPSEYIQVPQVTGRLESYYRSLSHSSTQHICQYRLSLTESSPFESIAAVTIRFKTSLDTYSPVPDFQLLFLSKLNYKDLRITLTPEHPQPTVFSVQVMFSSEDHRTFSTSLDPLEVTFTDLAMPLPWEEVGVSGLVEQHRLFDGMWGFLTGDGEGESAHGVESAQVLKCGAAKVCTALAAYHLLPCPDSRNSPVDKFFLFLPPSYHLLLKMYPVGQKQVVSIATDYWKILPCFSRYISLLDSSSS